MDKKYEQMELVAGTTIDHVVKELLSHKENGKLVSVRFNGVTLYSDTVTIDDAYKQVVGKTKSEFDKMEREWKENYARKKQE